MAPSRVKTSLRALAPLAWVGGFVLSLAVLLSIGETDLNHFRHDLGSRGLPTPGYSYFLLLWILFGSSAALCLAMALSRIAPAHTDRWKRAVDRLPEAPLVVALSLLAAALPLLIRAYVLQGSPVTDDEASYRFGAQLLASGRLSVPSPPMKLFFDREFIVNGGTMYSQYFLGWPALMVPGVWLGAPGAMNAIYAALSIPPLYLALRRMTNRRWALVGALLYLTSPLLMMSAATMMSHTSCLMLFLWAYYLLLRAKEGGWRNDLGFAAAASAMFFVRPSVGLGYALPLGLWWLLGLRGRPRRRQLAAALGIALPVALFGGLFLWVNKAQSGSPFVTGYQAAATYAHQNEYRFYNFAPPSPQFGTPAPEQPVIAHEPLETTHLLSMLGITLLRLNSDVFGWPLLVIFLLFAGWSPAARPCWLCLLSYLLLHVVLIEPGVDSFGPVHYVELSGPIILLTVLGARRLREALGRVGAALAPRRALAEDEPGEAAASGPAPSRLGALPMALLVSLVLVALLGYLPFRLLALERIGQALQGPHRLVAKAGVKRAIVFAPRPFVPPCASAPVHHWVFWWPQNDPDLKNDVLWANHISVADDRRLMKHFPDRTGYVMVWNKKSCAVAIAALDRVKEDEVPRGTIGGSNRGPD